MITKTLIQLELYRADLQSQIAKLCAEEREVAQRLEEEYTTVSIVKDDQD